MCGGGQKWGHLQIDEFALQFHSKRDEPDCEGFALLDHTFPKGCCSLDIGIKKRSN